MPKKYRILWVDDDPDNKIESYHKNKLVMAGYDVTLTRSVPMAMKSISKSRPDLVLLDLVFGPQKRRGRTSHFTSPQLSGAQARHLAFEKPSNATVYRHFRA